MKKESFIMCAVMALVLFSCEKAPKGTPEYDPMKSLPESVVQDFRARYPEATDIEVHGEEEVSVSLIDRDGFKNKVVYVKGEWMYSQKMLDVHDFLNDLPMPVRKTYVKTGINHEIFYENSHYVLEIERAGMAWKQYEIDCLGSYMDGDELIENLVYHIAIAEDGTLLAYSHGQFNLPIWWVDLTSAIAFVREKYENASIVGSANNGEQYIYIRHKGILKTVTFRPYPSSGDFEWKCTEYALPMDAALPAHVRKEIVKFEAQHPGKKLFELSMLETIDGFFYGMKIGTELESIKTYVDVHEKA